MYLEERAKKDEKLKIEALESLAACAEANKTQAAFDIINDYKGLPEDRPTLIRRYFELNRYFRQHEREQKQK